MEYALILLEFGALMLVGITVLLVHTIVRSGQRVARELTLAFRRRTRDNAVTVRDKSSGRG